jgi:hypothetical protein
MELYDTLQICLLSLASRYPDHVVDMNEELLGPQKLGARGWLALDMIEQLESTQPELLRTMAHIVVDTQKSEIYLLEHDEELPAFLIHCRGRLPGCQGDAKTRRTTGALSSQKLTA